MKSVLLYLPGRSDLRKQLLRQTPGGKGEWKGYQFYLNESPEPCDYVVVFAGHQEVIKHPVGRSQTLFIAGEPPSIKRYNEEYLAQFGSVISSDPDCGHPHLSLTQQGHPWFCGRKFLDQGGTEVVKSYDDYVQEGEPEKTKLISVVCSDKQSKPGHRKRYEFVQRLKEAFGDELDLFGTGRNMIADKAEAIRPYQYHIAIENSSYPHYWTEKLSDCYLEGALPIYAGCPNVGSYFSEDAYCVIDLDDPDGAVKLIREAIDEGRYEQSKPSLAQAKEQVLGEYNLFQVIASHFDSLEVSDTSTVGSVRVFPQKYFRKGRVGRFFHRIFSDCFSVFKS